MPKWSDQATAKGALPPPPAPVARDANPWPMPARQGDAPQARLRRPRGGLATPQAPIAPGHIAPGKASAQLPPGRGPSMTKVSAPPTISPAPSTMPSAPSAPSARPTSPTSRPTAESRPAITRFIPFAVFLAVLGSIASTAIEAFGRGDRIGAVIPLLVVAIIAIGWWRAMRRQRRR
jgi:hypothetical protein